MYSPACVCSARRSPGTRGTKNQIWSLKISCTGLSETASNHDGYARRQRVPCTMLQTQRFQDSCPFLDGHTDVLISRGSYWLKISGSFGMNFSLLVYHGTKTSKNPTKRSVISSRCVKKPNHITAILGYRLCWSRLPRRVRQRSRCCQSLAEIRRRGFDFSGNVFDADRGYDADYLQGSVLDGHDTQHAEKGRRQSGASQAPRRQPGCLTHGLVEGIFGAEESRRHSFTADSCAKTIGAGLPRDEQSHGSRVLNRFECACRLNIPIPSYGGSAQHGVRLMIQPVRI